MARGDGRVDRLHPRRSPLFRAAIRRTLAQYCQLCDDGRFDEWIDLFTVDARFEVMGRSYEGRDAIKAFMEVGQSPERRGRHMIGEPVVVMDVDGAGSAAHAWTDYVFIDKDRTITSIGRYHDELVLHTGDRWRFALREIVFQGDEPKATRPPPG